MLINVYQRKTKMQSILNPPEKIEEGFKDIKTSVSIETLEEINHELIIMAKSFYGFSKGKQHSPKKKKCILKMEGK